METVKHFPRPDLEPEKGSETASASRKFRDVLANFPTGVCVVTSLNEKGEKIGLTVNSFTSLSLEPPLVLWCLSLDSGLVDHYQKGKRFNINFLAEDQAETAIRFAKPGEEKFSRVKTTEGKDGVPMLDGSTGLLECRVEEIYPGGDHLILVSRVLGFAKDDKPPLLFHKSKFKTL